jgi:hypothetical protein
MPGPKYCCEVDETGNVDVVVELTHELFDFKLKHA